MDVVRRAEQRRELARARQLRVQRKRRFQGAHQVELQPTPEPEPEIEPEIEIEPEPEIEPQLSQPTSDACGTPRVKTLEEMSVQEMISMSLSSIDNIDSMNNVDSFDSFVNVDRGAIREKIHRAEMVSIRDSEERFVQQSFDEMVRVGKITHGEIEQKVQDVVTGTKCGMINARRILLDHDMDVNESIQYYIGKVGEGSLLTTAAGGVLAHTAVAQGRLERERRRRFEPADPEKLLCIAAARGDVKLMERLLDEGVSPNSRDPIGGYPALHYAAEYNHVPAIQLLLRRGVNMEAKDEWGQMTAYTWGSVAGSGDAVNCLLRAGCRMEARDVIGRTGQDFARVRQHEGVKAAIDVEMSARRFRALNRHYSTMIRRPESYPAIRDPTIIVPTIAEEEAQRARDEVTAALAKMLAGSGPLGTVRERARAIGLEHTLDHIDLHTPTPPQDERKTPGSLLRYGSETGLGPKDNVLSSCRSAHAGEKGRPLGGA